MACQMVNEIKANGYEFDGISVALYETVEGGAVGTCWTACWTAVRLSVSVSVETVVAAWETVVARENAARETAARETATSVNRCKHFKNKIKIKNSECL